jgi:hypothetical protein
VHPLTEACTACCFYLFLPTEQFETTRTALLCGNLLCNSCKLLKVKDCIERYRETAQLDIPLVHINYPFLVCMLQCMVYADSIPANKKYETTTKTKYCVRMYVLCNSCVNCCIIFWYMHADSIPLLTTIIIIR